jgi:hypothetical protein
MRMNGSPSNLDRLPEPPNATAVFVLGLLSLIMCAPLGIFAWAMGSSAKREVAAGVYRSSDLLNAGYIMGIIGTVLLIIPLLLALVWVVVVVLFAGIGAAVGAG